MSESISFLAPIFDHSLAHAGNSRDLPNMDPFSSDFDSGCLLFEPKGMVHPVPGTKGERFANHEHQRGSSHGCLAWGVLMKHICWSPKSHEPSPWFFHRICRTPVGRKRSAKRNSFLFRKASSICSKYRPDSVGPIVKVHTYGSV